MSRLFVDLDGVLTDFEAGARDVLGMSVKDFQELHGEALMWRRLEAAFEFYQTLPWMAGGGFLWEQLKDPAIWPGPPPIILTGLPLGEWAEPQKRAWCARELGAGVPVICCMSIEKAGYCNPGDVLIDDRASARLDWQSAGGVFIEHSDGVGSLAALATIVND